MEVKKTSAEGSAPTGGKPAVEEQKPPTKTLAERAEAGEKLTIAELAEATKNAYAYRPFATMGGSSENATGYTPAHAAAAQLHGWNAHSSHTADPLTLTLSDYKAALKAGSEAPKGKQTYEPHEAACSPYRPKEQ